MLMPTRSTPSPAAVHGLVIIAEKISSFCIVHTLTDPRKQRKSTSQNVEQLRLFNVAERNQGCIYLINKNSNIVEHYYN